MLQRKRAYKIDLRFLNVDELNWIERWLIHELRAEKKTMVS